MSRSLVLLALLAAPALAPAEAPAAAAAGPRIEIRVTQAGFEPRQVRVKRGQPTTLAFTRTTDQTCMTAIDVPEEGVKDLQLPLGQTVTVTITPARKGVEPFHCSAMAMGKGRIVVED